MVNPCQCEACSDTPAPTYTRAYLLECEARFVQRLRRARRLEYFDKVERRRGLDGLIVLKHAIAKLPPPQDQRVR